MRTGFLNWTRFWKENSIPRVNNRRIMPASASIWTAFVSAIKASPWGPASTPVIRKPTMTGT